MAHGPLHRSLRLRLLVGSLAFWLAAAAWPACSCCGAALSPTNLTVVAGQTSRPATLKVNCIAPERLSFQVHVTPDLPGGPRAEPSPVVVTFPPGMTKASATFRLVTTTATRPGLYTVTVTNQEIEVSASMTLTVEEPRGRVAIQPSRLTAVPGEVTPPLLLQLSETNLSGLSLRFDLVLPGSLAGFVTAQPEPVLLAVPDGGSSAPFQLQIALAAPPGTFEVGLREAGSGLQAVVALTIEAPRVTATVNPAEVAVAPAQSSPPLTLVVETNLSGITFEFTPRLPPVFAGRVSLIPAVVRVVILPGSHRGETSFQVAAAEDAPPGAGTVVLSAPLYESEAELLLRVEPSRARLSVVPRRVAVPPGQAGPAQELHVANTNLTGVALSFEADWPASLRGLAVLEPAELALVVPGEGGSAKAAFQVRCGLEAPPGTYTVHLADREHDLRTAFELEIPPLGGRAELAPRSVFLHPGDTSSPLTLRVSDGNLAGLPLSFESRMPPELSRSCLTVPETVQLILAPGASSAEAQLRVVCSPDAPAGLYGVDMVEPRFGLRAGFRLEIGPLPRIGSVNPASVAAGSIALVLRLEGSGFQPGATVSSPSPLLRFGSTRVLTAELAETTVSVRSDAPPGPYRLDLANPDGGTTRDGATLLVHPAGALGAPLGVRTSAIVFPLPGALMAVDEKVYALGLLATTGTGTLAGIWLLDGVPFDRFVAHAEGGLPVHLRSTMPIPRSTLGPHRLQLAIESPQRFLSEAVTVTQVLDRADRFRLLAPVDGALVPPGPVRFRWTPMPGTEGYEIEVYREEGTPALRRRTPLPVWSPGERDLATMAPGPWLWRVRPLFTGGVPGPFSAPWRCLVLPREARLSRLSLRFLPVWRPAGGGARVALALGGMSLEWMLPGQEPEAAPAAETPDAEGPAWTLSGNEILKQPGGDNLPNPPLDGTLALSGQVDRAGASSLLGATGSLSYTRTWPGGVEPQDNRSWTSHGSRDLAPGAVVRNLGGQAGYVSPSLVFGCGLMTIGANKGGSEATLALPGNLSLSYYETFDGDLAGLASGVLASRESLRAGALAGTLGGIKLRAVGLELDQTGSELAPGGRGSLFGLLATYEGARFQVVFEGARSDVSPDPESFATERRGEAYHLNLTGTWAGWNATATFDRAEASFGNPANQGLNATGAPDQSNATLSLGRSFGSLALSLALGHAEQGRTDSDSGRLNVTAPLSPRTTLTLDGRLSTTRSPAQDDWGLPASRVECRGGTLALAESLGGMTLGQQLSYDETRDRYNPAGFSATTAAGVTAAVTPLPRLTVSAGIQGNRMRAFGTSESLLVTLDPTWTLPSQDLTVHPSASYSRSRSDLQPGASATETYRLIVTWSPGWLRSLLGVEAGSDWSRMRSSGLPDEGFIRSYTVSLTLRGEKR